MFGEKTKLYEQRKMAARILQALTQTSLAELLKFYQRAIQNDLHLSDEEMTTLFSFSKFAELMTPDEPFIHKYKGVSVETWQELCEHPASSVTEKIPIPVDRPTLSINFVTSEEDKIPIPVDRPCIFYNESVQIPEKTEIAKKEVSSSDDEKNEAEDSLEIPSKNAQDERNEEEESSSSDEEENESPIEILQRKLKEKGLNNLNFDDTKIPGSIIVTGKINLKKQQNEQIRTLGGVWTASEKGYTFNVKKLVK